jgi:hypothetical protein
MLDQGESSLFARPRRWAFRPLARREGRCDLSDHERRTTTPAAERPASLRVAAKIAAGFVEELDRMADALFALLLPRERFWLKCGLRK